MKITANKETLKVPTKVHVHTHPSLQHRMEKNIIHSRHLPPGGIHQHERSAILREDGNSNNFMLQAPSKGVTGIIIIPIFGLTLVSGIKLVPPALKGMPYQLTINRVNWVIWPP